MREEAQIKIENARQIKERIWECCFHHVLQPTRQSQLKLGSLLGDLVNNLRSALNYTAVHFVETKLKPALSSVEYEKLQLKRDFPWADTKANFDKKPLVQHSQAHFLAIYAFLEQVQPYHTGQEWLADLMCLSNTDKHDIVIHIDDTPDVSALAWVPGQTEQPHKPKIFGDKLMFPTEQRLLIYQLPAYFAPFQLIAAPGGKWFGFWITVGKDRYRSLLAFSTELPDHVEKLVNDFEALL